MKANSMLDTMTSCLGLPSRAIPLSSCRIMKPYLLEQVDIPTTGCVILFIIPYLMSEDVNALDRNLSLYAVPRDYHAYVDELKKSVLPYLRACFPDHRFAMFTDHSPIAEVDAAARSGLGLFGQNGLLITPDYGSFVFIAEICTDANYETVTGQKMPSFPDIPPTCEQCGLCREACPSACFPNTEGQLPPGNGCLSALTQKKNTLNENEETMLKKHGLVWGCDACQLSCPHNRRVIEQKIDTPIPYFREKRIRHADATRIASMNDSEFAERAYAWRGRAVIQRNLSLQEEKP